MCALVVQVKFTASGQVIVNVEATPVDGPSAEEDSAIAAAFASSGGLPAAPGLGSRMASSNSNHGSGISSLSSAHGGMISDIVSPRVAPSWFLLRVDVIDSGIGISAQSQKRLFTSFSQAHREISARYGGTGLGLAISKSLVELLGGKIGLESSPGQGARFFFELKVRGTRLQDVSATQLPPHLHLPSHRKAAALLRLQQEQTQQSMEGNAECMRLTASSETSLSPSAPPRRRPALLIHSNTVVLAPLRSMLDELDLDCTAATSFEAYRSSSGFNDADGQQPIPFSIVLFDAASILAAHELPVVSNWFQRTRVGQPGGQRSTTLVAFLPLGATRRALEECTDSIVTQPIKSANLYAAVHRSQAASAAPLDHRSVARPLPPISVPPATPIHPTSAVSAHSMSSTPLFSPPFDSNASPPYSTTPAPAAASSPVPSSMSASSSKRPAAVVIPLHQLSSFATNYPLRILIVEDNSINQRLISKMLTRLGYTALQFRLTGDGQSAAEEIQRENTLSIRSDSGNDAATSDTGSGNKDKAAEGVDSLSAPHSAGAAPSGTTAVPSALSPYHLVLMDLQVSSRATSACPVVARLLWC